MVNQLIFFKPTRFISCVFQRAVTFFKTCLILEKYKEIAWKSHCWVHGKQRKVDAVIVTKYMKIIGFVLKISNVFGSRSRNVSYGLQVLPSMGF